MERWCGRWRRRCARVWTTRLRPTLPSTVPCPLARVAGTGRGPSAQHPAPLAHPSSSLTEPRPALIIWFPALGHQASRGRAPALAWVVQEGVPEAPGEGTLGARGSPWQRSQRRQCVFSRRCAAHAGNVGHRTPPWAVQAPCGTQGWASRRAEGPVQVTPSRGRNNPPRVPVLGRHAFL